MSKTTCLCAIAQVMILTACGAVSEPPDHAASLVLAEDRLGAITARDLDRFMIEQTPTRRWRPDADPVARFTEATRRLAVERLLLVSAEASATDQTSDFAEVGRNIDRLVFTDHYLKETVNRTPITEEDLEAAYEERPDRFNRPERREVLHIFKRLPKEGNPEELVSELESLRQRILGGESFEMVARTSSDSESRHNDGRLGFVVRGQHSDDFDRVVFNLETGTPSEPVKTRDGGHLFFVASVLDAQSYTFDEVRSVILRELIGNRQKRALVEAAAALPTPEGLFSPGPREVAAIVAGGDPAAVVLSLGEFALTVSEYNEMLVAVRRQLGGRAEPDLPQVVLEEIRCREVIFQHMMAEGLPALHDNSTELERRRQLVETQLRILMRDRVANAEETIQRHYDDHRMRFATPLMVHIRMLAVPLDDDPSSMMDRLEHAREALNEGSTDLASLAVETGGEVQDLGMVSPALLQRFDPRALRFAFVLKPGEHSPPFRTGNALVIFQVIDRAEPSAQPLALVRDAVIDDYVVNNATEVYRDLTDEMLHEAGFVLYEDRLARFGPVLETASD